MQRKDPAATSFQKASAHSTELKKMGAGFEPQINDLVFAETKYGKEFLAYQSTVMEEMKALGMQETVRNQIDAELKKLVSNAGEMYDKAVKNTGPWEQKDWQELFKQTNENIKKAVSSASGLPEEKTKTFEKKTADKLKEFETDELDTSAHELQLRLKNQHDRDFSANKRLLLGLEEAERFNYAPWGKKHERYLFKPTDVSLTEEDLKKDSSNLYIQTENKDDFRREMKRLQESSGRLFECQTEPFKGRMFEVTRLGVRPQPPMSSDPAKYREEFGHALELMRFLKPGCKAILAQPEVTEFYEQHQGKEESEPRFINASYVKERLTAVMLESQARGIPMKIDANLRVYLKTQQAKDPNSKKGKAIKELFDLEIQMEKQFVKNTVGGKNSTEMEQKVDTALKKLDEQKDLNLEGKYQDARAKAEEELSARPAFGTAPAAPVPLDSMTPEQKDRKIEERAMKKFIDDAVPDYKTANTPDEKQLVLAKELDDIEAKRAVIAKTQETGAIQLSALDGLIQGENKDSKDGMSADRDPFLTVPFKDEKGVQPAGGHIQRLETLADMQKQKLTQLDLRAKAVQQAAEDLAAKNPERKPTADEAKKCRQKVEASLTENQAQAIGVNSYKTQRQNENVLREQKKLEEKVTAGPGK
ncbi:MAG TPA: hypothetical protein VLI69_02430 [Gammaproteobacteria bacterium]|nr:hypothetical protein [Gammaproteobacteria bacterium]